MTRRRWSAQDEQLLRELYPHTRTDAIAERFGRSIRCVYAKAQDLGLKKSAEYLASPDACRLRRESGIGAASRFRKGHPSWNKGVKGSAGLHPNSVAHQFQPGELSGRAAKLVQPVGALRVSTDGYLERKVGTRPGASNRRWKGVHRLVWEAANGPVSDGYMVVFRPGMKTTVLEEITLDRLEIITRREGMERNSVHTKYGPELARVTQLRGAITRQINKRERA